MPINRFRGKYMFLSNFCSCKHGVEFEGQIYPTSEHAYQAAKIENPTGRDSFVVGGSLGSNPMDAKRKGSKVQLRGGWNKLRTRVMLDICRSKFVRDSQMAAELLKTGNQKIVEGHTSDKFWGGKQNHLGRILMRIRSELRECLLTPKAPDALKTATSSSTNADADSNADADANKKKQKKKGKRQCKHRR